MLIKSLVLCEKDIRCKRVFSNGIIFLHSKNNSKGKTTFMRLLFYSLGYQIPSMRKLDFTKVKTVLEFEEKNRTFLVERNDNSFHVLVDGTTELDFALPAEHTAFLKYVFQEDNAALLSNILGFMYIDQDKGWSLLNRGTVIGKIKFNINELIAALNDVDISGLLEKEKRLLLEKNKYETIKNMQAAVDNVFEKNGDFVIPEVEKDIVNKIAYKRIEVQEIKSQISELNSAIMSQERLMNYLDNLNLVVSNGENVEIVVNRSTIVGAIPSTELLKARKSILSYEVDRIAREIQELQVELDEHRRKNDSIDLLSNSNKYSRTFYEFNSFLELNQANILDLIDEINKELSTVRTQISNNVKNNNNYIKEIYDKVFEYSKQLQVDDYIIKKEDFIFTTDLKSLSGTILSKIIFAFKLAFLKTIETKLNTKLIFAIDSPRSKEMDAQNYELVLKLIKKELADNQVFIATIFDVSDYKKKFEFTGLAICSDEVLV